MAEVDDLATFIRSELLAKEPSGFGAHRSMSSQGETIEALAASLKQQSSEVVEKALTQLVATEMDSWTFLKLVELCKVTKPAAAAEAILARVENPPPESSERRLFMQGCACEVLLSLPLDADLRKRAETLCGPALFHLDRVRSAVDDRIRSHRPRTTEWLIVGGAMLAIAAAIAYVLLAR